MIILSNSDLKGIILNIIIRETFIINNKEVTILSK